jgi:glutamyl-tRNA reductase
VHIDDRHFFRSFTCGAVSHLYKVASAIDSQILGDMQILGQVKSAYDLAVTSGSVGNVLSHMFMGAFHTGKRVRTETSVGIGAVSISFAAVELARKIFADLHRKKVLLIGAGETGALAARHLISKGVGDITITNRTHARAVELANELHAKVAVFDDFPRVMADVDIVITATAAPDTVVKHDMVREAIRHRRNRTLLIIDIALPRDVDPSVDELPNVFLKDIDALQGIVDQNLEKRRMEIPRAETIVTEEVVNFFIWFNALEATPTIQQLREKFEQVRVAELDKFRAKIGSADLEIVDMLTKRIVNKLLHPTMVSLKEPVDDSAVLAARLQVLREVFDLDEPAATPHDTRS